MTAVHLIFSDIVSKAMSQIYGSGWSVAELDQLHNAFCPFKHNVVNIFRLSAHSDYLH